ncbi:MAG: AAA family ATPase [Chlamydiota bacterium]
MKPLPSSIQHFPRLITSNYLYIDKTKYAHDLIIQEQSFLLARPHGFGKSLFVSTLAEILKGNRELFEGLWIGGSGYTWPTYGVIHLDFGPIDSTNSHSVKQSLCQILARIAHAYQLPKELNTSNPNQALIELTDALYAKFKRVAVLIDEYDHPILQVLQDPQAPEVRSVLQSFFTTVKSLNNQVNFLFITGVSMFSKAGVFSGMNNPINISLDPRFAGICGYTEEEMASYFQEYIADWAKKENIPQKQLQDELKTWYNGYRFSKDPTSVYNPFSILNAFNLKEFRNFWFETGSPVFIMKELKKEYRHKEWALFDLERFKVSSGLLGSVDVDAIPLPTLLFQTGYLTIAEHDMRTNNYRLEFPNQEVKTALNQHLLTFLAHTDSTSSDYAGKELRFLFDSGNVEGAVACLKMLFSQAPYQLHIEREQFYHGLLQVACHASGLKVQSEYSTSHARIDLMLDLPSRIYVVEVKFNESAEAALAQIEERRYYEPFLSLKKPIVLLGLSFKKEPCNFEISYVKKDLIL